MKIHDSFKPFTFQSLDEELKVKKNQHHPYVEAHCIIPFYYKKDLSSDETILGMYGNVRMDSDRKMVYVYPAREFPSGKTNEEGKLCYCYPANQFPEIFSFENITTQYQFAVALGGIIDMVDPFKKLKYIYDFEKD